MRQTGEFMDLEPGFDIYLCRDGYICLSELALTIGEMKAAPNVSVHSPPSDSIENGPYFPIPSTIPANDPAHRLSQQRAVADIPLKALDLSAPQSARVAPFSHQHFNPVPATHQFLDEIPADKTRRASDKAIHDQTQADNSGFSRGNRSENFPPTLTS